MGPGLVRSTRLLFCILLPLCLGAQAVKYYYFHPEINYGTDYYFNPANMMINGAFDIVRTGSHTKNIWAIDFQNGFNSLKKNVGSPIDAIDRYGWDNFIRREFFNISFDVNEAQFLPNILNHVIGNGLLYVKAAEWYDFHSFRYPYLLSGISTTIYQIVNEAVETEKSRKVNVDPISDLLMFNVLGLVVFSFEGTKIYFTKTVPVYEWSLQPMLNPSNKYLENTGQNYCAKIPIGKNDRTALFLYWGVHALAGISYKTNETNTLSIGLGGVVNNILGRIESDVIYFIPKIDGSMGIFYDRNNSLLTSLLIAGPKLFSAQLNVYPGLLKVRNVSPGLYIGIGKVEGFQIGLSIVHVPIGVVHRLRSY